MGSQKTNWIQKQWSKCHCKQNKFQTAKWLILRKKSANGKFCHTKKEKKREKELKKEDGKRDNNWDQNQVIEQPCSGATYQQPMALRLSQKI